MAKNLEIKAIIAAVDKITGPIRKISASIRTHLGGSFKSLAKGVGAAAGKIREWTGVALKAAAVGAAALVGAAVAATNAYLEQAGALADLSGQLGVSVEFLQELRYAAGLAGVGAEELDGGMQALAKSVGQAKAGTGKLAGYLKRTSPELLRQVKGAKSVEQAFDLMAGAIARTKDPTKRAALATAAFGGQGPKIARMLGEGTEGLERLRAEFRKTGAGLSTADVEAADELGDSLDTLKLSIMGVGVKVLSDLLPALRPVVKELTAWIQANRGMLASKLEKFLADVGEAVRRIDWQKLIADALELAKVAAGLFDKLGGLKTIAALVAGSFAVKLGGGIWTAIGAFKAVAVGIAAVAGVTVGTVALIAGAIALLIGAVALVIANWEDFEEFGAELWRTMRQLWADGSAAVVEFLEELWRTMRQGWADFYVWLEGIWTGIVGVFRWASDLISPIIDRVLQGVDIVAGGARKLGGLLGLGDDEDGAAPAPGRAPAPLPRVPDGAPLKLPSGPALALAAGGGAPAQLSGGVTVKFENPPPGMRVSEARSNTPGVAVSASVGRRSLANGVPA